MGGGDSAPAPQMNTQQTAQQQTQSNVNTAVANAALNNTNQVTPYGSLTYTQNGGQYIDGNFVPSYTATQTLSPQLQQLQGQLLGNIAPGVLNQVQQSVQNPLNFNNAPAMPTDQTAAINSAYNALMSRQNQQFGQQTAAQQAQLANQGISAGSTAYNNAMRPIEQAQTDASNQALLNATNLAGQNINQAQQLRNQAINEDVQLYNSPLQTYSTLLGFSNGTPSSNFVNTPQNQVQPTDVAGINTAAYQGQVNAYNTGRAAQGSMFGGIGGLLGSLGGAAILS